MPKLVDYASRYAFVRDAAFVLVRERGVEALTRRSLAAELGCGVNTLRRLVDGSAVLATLAAVEVANRRRIGRWGRRSDEPAEQARGLAHRLLPDDETRIDEELVWLRLVTAAGLVPSGLDEPGRVRRDFQVAERGWSDEDDLSAGVRFETTDAEADAAAAPRVPPTDPLRDALAPLLAERAAEVNDTVGLVLDLLGVTGSEEESREHARRVLTALVDGLTLAVCTGRARPEEAVATMDRHLADLADPPARVAG